MATGLSVFSQRLLDFSDRLRAKDFVAAERLLRKLVADPESTPSFIVGCRADLLFRQGRAREAFELLTEIIDNGQDEFQACRLARADEFLDRGHWDDALADYRIILVDPTPEVVERFRDSARIRICYILARRGSKQFEELSGGLSPNLRTFIVDGVYSIEDLWRIYEAKRGGARS